MKQVEENERERKEKQEKGDIQSDGNNNKWPM